MDRLQVSNNARGGTQIQIQGLEKAHLDVTTTKISDLTIFSKIKIYFNELFKEKLFIKLQTSDGPHLVKISELIQELGISKMKIIELEEDQMLDDFIIHKLKADHDLMTSSTFLQYDPEDLKDLQRLAHSHQLPFLTVVEAMKQGNLDALIQQAQETEKRIDETCRKLDQLYIGNQGKLVAKDSIGGIRKTMSLKELDAVKAIIRIAYRTLAMHPTGGKDFEQIIPISKTYKILVKATADTFQITGLFGKLLGEGGYGVAIHTIDLLNATLSERDPVLKVPKMRDPESIQIMQEVELLNKIHASGKIMGIQEKLRGVRDLFTGKSTHYNLGRLYQTNLFDIATHPGTRQDFDPIKKISMGYQLLYGLSYMHNLNITHGDIKPNNIFFNPFAEGLGDDPAVFLGDFGGAMDHSKVIKKIVRSPYFKPFEDMNAAKKALRNGQTNLFLDIQKKSDVFAICTTLCLLFSPDYLPFDKSPGKGPWSIVPNLAEILQIDGLKQETIELLLRGMDHDYTKRPNMSEIFEAFDRELFG